MDLTSFETAYKGYCTRVLGPELNGEAQAAFVAGGIAMLRVLAKVRNATNDMAALDAAARRARESAEVLLEQIRRDNALSEAPSFRHS
jgi:hypothetical protein